jgi:hypothetical protein
VGRVGLVVFRRVQSTPKRRRTTRLNTTAPPASPRKHLPVPDRLMIARFKPYRAQAVNS